MLRFVANAKRLAGVVAERCVSVGGLAIIVDRAGSEAFRFGWLKIDDRSGTGSGVLECEPDSGESGVEGDSKDSGGRSGAPFCDWEDVEDTLE